MYMSTRIPKLRQVNLGLGSYSLHDNFEKTCFCILRKIFKIPSLTYIYNEDSSLLD
jgi:hypothetical protein